MHNPHIIYVTKSWFKSTDTDSNVNINGYACFRNNTVNKLGGGIFMLVKKNLAPVRVAIIDSLDSQEFNIVVYDLTSNLAK